MNLYSLILKDFHVEGAEMGPERTVLELEGEIVRWETFSEYSEMNILNSSSHFFYSHKIPRSR